MTKFSESYYENLKNLIKRRSAIKMLTKEITNMVENINQRHKNATACNEWELTDVLCEQYGKEWCGMKKFSASESSSNCESVGSYICSSSPVPIVTPPNEVGAPRVVENESDISLFTSDLDGGRTDNQDTSAENIISPVKNASHCDEICSLKLGNGSENGNVSGNLSKSIVKQSKKNKSNIRKSSLSSINHRIISKSSSSCCVSKSSQRQIKKNNVLKSKKHFPLIKRKGIPSNSNKKRRFLTLRPSSVSKTRSRKLSFNKYLPTPLSQSADCLRRSKTKRQISANSSWPAVNLENPENRIPFHQKDIQKPTKFNNLAKSVFRVLKSDKVDRNASKTLRASNQDFMGARSIPSKDQYQFGENETSNESLLKENQKFGGQSEGDSLMSENRIRKYSKRKQSKSKGNLRIGLEEEKSFSTFSLASEPKKFERSFEVVLENKKVHNCEKPEETNNVDSSKLQEQPQIRAEDRMKELITGEVILVEMPKRCYYDATSAMYVNYGLNDEYDDANEPIARVKITTKRAITQSIG